METLEPASVTEKPTPTNYSSPLSDMQMLISHDGCHSNIITGTLTRNCKCIYGGAAPEQQWL